MTDTTRLTLITHALTPAVRAARFPRDEPLDPHGERTLTTVRPIPADLILTAPELRTRQTAAAFALGRAPADCGPTAITGPAPADRAPAGSNQGLANSGLADSASGALVDPALADLNHGDWAGKTMDELPPDALMAWLTDPTFEPPGGESITALLDRVAAWLVTRAATPQRVISVTHPAVVRAVVLRTLDAPPKSFWRIDIPPATATTLHARAATWTLRSTAVPL
ncbi:histidine phosphatase family protein [Nocardia sp. NPDC004068]|uniref:histidine phosphatase family protein n=1 Tax=Nocardia sp. NPDC004068 TaxID=3364303 RepID=UPI0036A48BD6